MCRHFSSSAIPRRCSCAEPIAAFGRSRESSTARRATRPVAASVQRSRERNVRAAYSGFSACRRVTRGSEPIARMQTVRRTASQNGTHPIAKRRSAAPPRIGTDAERANPEADMRVTSRPSQGGRQSKNPADRLASDVPSTSLFVAEIENRPNSHGCHQLQSNGEQPIRVAAGDTSISCG